MLNGEIISPPAGAIGRGDAFVLRIAERTGAIVLSNDSFQEFHGEHPWLFDDSRLIGGKPVPGVGWIFTPRLPIRGPKSRAATAEAKVQEGPGVRSGQGGRAGPRRQEGGQEVVQGQEGGARRRPRSTPRGRSRRRRLLRHGPSWTRSSRVPSRKPWRRRCTRRSPRSRGMPRRSTRRPRSRRRRGVPRPSGRPPPPSTGTAGGTAGSRGRRPRTAGARRRSRPPRRRRSTSRLAFINFVAAFAVGNTVDGEVVSFTSHGAMVDVSLPGGGVLHCYIPLTAMGTPPPTKARQVLKKGEVRPFVLAGLDPPRRVAELALPSGAPEKRSPGKKESAREKSASATKKAPAKKVAQTPAKKAAARPRRPPLRPRRPPLRQRRPPHRPRRPRHRPRRPPHRPRRRPRRARRRPRRRGQGAGQEGGQGSRPRRPPRRRPDDDRRPPLTTLRTLPTSCRTGRRSSS